MEKVPESFTKRTFKRKKAPPKLIPAPKQHGPTIGFTPKNHEVVDIVFVNDEDTTTITACGF